MIRHLAVLAAILLLSGMDSPPPLRIGDVAWLQGCWEFAAGDRTVEEHWFAPRAGTMLGASRTVRRGELAEYELMLIREHSSGLAYEAHPNGQPATTFLARDFDGHDIVFENTAHDFPQRIGYRRDGDGGLFAWIEGTQGGGTRRIEFPYRAEPCTPVEAQ